MRHPSISMVQLVIRPQDKALAAEALNGMDILPMVHGGATRQESVRAGLAALVPHAPEYVLVHDAARPLVSLAIIDRVLDALAAGAHAVLPTVAVAETLKRVDDGAVVATMAREGVHGAQTPQGFAFAPLFAWHQQAPAEAYTDDAALAEAHGARVVCVAGERRNIKLTTQDDMDMAQALMAASFETRTGQGYDVHQLVPCAPDAPQHTMLCGVAVPHTHRLKGHSDADVGLHALVDAMLGALAEGDIGAHFPPSDAQWKGASSDQFVRYAAQRVQARGARMLHADVTLICEAPKIGPHRDPMRAAIAAMLGVDITRVSVKATTTEGLGFAGRREGIAAQALVTLQLPAGE
jgi:2-C-methyl-D-erythritol 4-phosphate cytidylyltransferase / 2-C-methyl-D-erythritol 2,4-cyclodiphosphate synthase